MAKTKRLQKRRKVWVSKEGAFIERQWSFDPPLARFKGRFEAFVEFRPGDVVLSREEVAEMKAIIMALVSRSDFPAHYDRALALLRGRR